MDAICTRCSQTHSTAENIKYDEGGQGLRVERSSSRTQVRMRTTVLLTPSLTTSSSLMDGLLSCNQYVLLYSIYIFIYISLYISFIFIPARLHFTSLCSPSDYPRPTGGNVVSPRVHCQQHGWMLLLLMSAYPDALKFMMDSDVLFAFTAGIRICCKKKCYCIDWADGEGNNSLSPLLVCTRSACSIVCSCGRQGCLYQQSNFTLHPSIFLSISSPPISFDCSILSESSMCVCDYFLFLSSVLSLTLHCFSFFVSCYHSSHWKKILIF